MEMGTGGNIERERRFLVDGRYEKPWRGEVVKHITQHYLPPALLTLNETNLEYDGTPLFCLSENDLKTYRENTGWGARLRRQDEAFIFTSKTKGKLDDAAANYEIEGFVSKETYDRLLMDRTVPHISKIRYVWEDAQGLEWEIDEFEGSLAGLVLAEVELETDQAIEQIPDWAGQEITGLKSWSNRALAETLAQRTR